VTCCDGRESDAGMQARTDMMDETVPPKLVRDASPLGALPERRGVWQGQGFAIKPTPYRIDPIVPFDTLPLKSL
jgi:hypothetical protein